MKKTIYFIALLLVPVLKSVAQEGTPDLQFGGGKITTSISTDDEFCNAVVVQPDHKIVVAGTVSFNGAYADFAFVRYAQNGALDHRFGNNGKIDDCSRRE